jgi:diguanylate cyclase (GGDEF)-like protein
MTNWSIFSRMVVLGVGTTLVVSLAVILIGERILGHEADLSMADTARAAAARLSARIARENASIDEGFVPSAVREIVADDRLLAVVVLGADRSVVTAQPEGVEGLDQLAVWPGLGARIRRARVDGISSTAHFVDLDTRVDSAAGAWIVLDRRPSERAVRNFRKASAVVGLLATVLGGLLSAMAAAVVTRSIGNLGDTLAGMAQEEREMHHSEQGPKEIARLARQVNRLGELVERYRFEQSTTAARSNGKLRGHARYLEQTNRALIDIANRDPLTGLANRRRLELELERHIELALQSENPLAVIMMDLDNFKVYNDSAGHLAGDILLQAVADALRARTRVTDVVVRWGGDEFCILMPYTTADRAVAAAKSLIESVCEATRSVPGASDEVGASAGVACFPDDAQKGSELIAAADAALYQVKETGRGEARRSRNGAAKTG